MNNFKESLNGHKVPKLIGDLMHSNHFLKMFALGALGLSVFAMATTLGLSSKPPLVLTLSVNGQEVKKQIELPKAEDQIEAAIRKYIELRYRWEPTNVQSNLTSATEFIHPTSRKAFQGSISNVIRFSTEKQVTQRAYPTQVKVNLQDKIVQVLGDRITAIQGMMAAGPLKLELSFESGDRTKENPWGVYISKEKEAL